MLLDLSWINVIIIMILFGAGVSGLVAVVGMTIQWRLDSIQHQLNDRMVMFQRVITSVEKRLDKLEETTIEKRLDRLEDQQ